MKKQTEDTPIDEYEWLNEIDFETVTRIDKNMVDYDGIQIDMRIRLTETAKQAIKAKLKELKEESK